MQNLKFHMLFLFLFMIGCSFEEKTIVSFDGDKYSVADFKDRFQFAPADDSIKKMEKVQEFVNQMLIIKEARQRGYGDDPVVQAAFDTNRRDVIWHGYYKETVLDKIKISDAELKKMYNKIIEQYHLAQIIVAEESLANYLVKELRKGGSFEELLRFSLDTLSENGDIGTYSAISIPDEVLKHLKKTKVNGVTDVIEFGGQYRIFKVLEYKRADKPTFDEVKENIRTNLWREKAMAEGEKFSEELLTKSKIEYNPEGIDAILKPDSLITEKDLNKWVVKKYDTSYVYVRTIRDAVRNLHQRSNIGPEELIERELIPDLIYDRAVMKNFDKKPATKKELQKNFSLILYQKLYSDEILVNADIDSTDIVDYYQTHKDNYKDKKYKEAYLLIKSKLREEKIKVLRQDLFEKLNKKYNPVINEKVLARLLKEEK